MLLFVAADRMEFAGLLRFCAQVAPAPLPLAWARAAELGGNRIVMAANGAGARQAGKAVEAVEGAQAVISTGFCGALDPGLKIGDIFVANSIAGAGAVETPRTARRFARGALASVDHVVRTAAEKAKLRAAGASAVEMEAAGVAQQATRLGVPFFCVRAVTDLAGESFANDFEAALRPDGHFATMQILSSAIRHPAKRLPELIRLRRRCAIAARALGEFLADCRF